MKINSTTKNYYFLTLAGAHSTTQLAVRASTTSLCGTAVTNIGLGPSPACTNLSHIRIFAANINIAKTLCSSCYKAAEWEEDDNAPRFVLAVLLFYHCWSPPTTC